MNNKQLAEGLGLSHLSEVLMDVFDERKRQDKKWGEQNYPITEQDQCTHHQSMADAYKEICKAKIELKRLTWREILLEEVNELFAESDPKRQREELVQVAAVAVAMIQNLDRDNERSGVRRSQTASETEKSN